MSVYTNKRFVKQAEVLKKKQQHDETWASLCSQVKALEKKEQQQTVNKNVPEENKR